MWSDVWRFGCEVVCGGGGSVQSVHVVCLICRSFLKEKFLLLFFKFFFSKFEFANYDEHSSGLWIRYENTFYGL